MSLWNWNLGVILFTGFIRIVLVQQEHLDYAECSAVGQPKEATMRCPTNPLRSDLDAFLIPDNLDKNIEGLILSPDDLSKFICFNITAENNLLLYPKLRRLAITRNIYMHKEGCNERIYANTFKDLNTLGSLEFTRSDLQNLCVIPLPKNLKKIDLSFNSYERVDLRWCPKLEEINLQCNVNMTRMPQLYQNPLPPLKKLNLIGNRMDNMTILDLAPLCNLTSLELDEVPGLQKEVLNSKGNTYYCQCEIFINWAKEYNISGLKLNCQRPNNFVGNADCSDAKKEIESAKKLHQKQCSLEQSSTTTTTTTTTMPSMPSANAKDSTSTVIIISFFAFLALLLIALFVYTFSHLVLRKKPPDEVMVNEEGEGEEEEDLDEPSDIPGRTDSRYAGQDDGSLDEPSAIARTDSRYAG